MDPRDPRAYDPLDLLPANTDELITPRRCWEIIFDFCQNQQLANSYGRHLEISDFVTKFNSNLRSILNHVSTEISSRELSPKSFFNFQYFTIVCQAMCASNEIANSRLAYYFFHKAWSVNQMFQLRFILFCIESNHVAILLNSDPQLGMNKTVISFENLKNPHVYTKIASWNYQCVYRILLELSNSTGLSLLIEEIFQQPLDHCPDLLILGLNECPIINDFKANIMIRTMEKFLYPPSTSSHNTGHLLQKLLSKSESAAFSWNQENVVKAMIGLYNHSTSDEQQHKLSRILDFSQELKLLNYLLSCDSYIFSIDVACLASRREYIKLDRWFKTKVDTIGKPFVEAAIAFVKRRGSNFSSSDKDGESANFSSLSKETLNVIRSNIQDYLLKNSEQNQDLLIKSSLFEQPTNCQSINSSMESIIDSYFQRLFNPDMPDSMTADEFVQTLMNLYSSADKNDKEILNNLLKVLIKELSFLSNYGEVDIILFGQVVGGIIQNGMLSGNSLIIVLKYLFHCLNFDSNSKLFKFVLTALDKCKTSIKAYSNLCVQMFVHQNFAHLPPLIQVYIEYGRSNMDPPANLIKSKIATNGLNPQLDEALETFKEKLNFLFNNLVPSKVQEFAGPLKSMLECNQLYSTASEYFIKRAMLEVNHHALMVEFLEAVGLKRMFELVSIQTYIFIKELLKSNLNEGQNSKKLYAIGSWLGMITLARNKPILAMHLDIRKLLVEAFLHYQHYLLTVIRFVLKIMLSIKKSRIFAPPNPWTVSILNIIAELYFEQESSLKLQIEVELFCKALEININEFNGRSEHLKNENFVKESDFQLTNRIELPRMGEQVEVDPKKPSVEDLLNEDNLRKFKQSLIFQSNLKILCLYPSLESSIRDVIVNTILNCLPEVHEKKLMPLYLTACQIVTKDFALNPSSQELISGAYAMVVTPCRAVVQLYSLELEKNLNEDIQLLLSQCPNINQTIIKTSVATIITDNIKVCLNFLATVCEQKARVMIFEGLEDQINIRQNRPNGQDYFDPEELKFQNERMPDLLRIKVGPTPKQDLVVYEQFAKPLSPIKEVSPTVDTPAPNNLSLQSNDDFIVYMNNFLLFIFSEMNQNSNNTTTNIYEYAVQLKNNPNDLDVVRKFVHLVVTSLRELMLQNESVRNSNWSKRYQENYLTILKAICEQHRNVSTLISQLLLEHWQKLNLAFPDSLFNLLSQRSLVNFNTLDSAFLRLLHESKKCPAGIKLVTDFLTCYIQNRLHESRFPQTIEFIRKSSNRPLSDLFDHEQDKLAEIGRNPDQVFRNWIAEINSEANFPPFICVEKEEFRGINFFRSALEHCILCCFKLLTTQPENIFEIHNRCYSYLDSFAELVLFVVKMKNTVETKISVLRTVLTLVLDSAKKIQTESSQKFIALPYYRVLVVLFLEMNYNSIYHHCGSIDSATVKLCTFNESIKLNLSKLFCDLLHNMNPALFPSFTFAWLEFISHRTFMGRCLEEKALWCPYFLLLRDLLLFLKQNHQIIELVQPFRSLYKGTIKLFMMLLHDFPSFLCEYCFLLNDSILESDLLLQNIVFTSSPSGMRFPEPTSDEITIDYLNDIISAYKGNCCVKDFEQLPFKKKLDEYLAANPTSNKFPNELQQSFLILKTVENKREILLTIKLLISFLGQYSVKYRAYFNLNTIGTNPSLIVIKSLLEILDSELRLYMIKSIANHLRYPNAETLFYICVLLYLFKESDVAIKEQIFRVFIERLLVRAFHPWGLIYVVNELSRNPVFDLWSQDFINYEPRFKTVLAKVGIATSN